MISHELLHGLVGMLNGYLYQNPDNPAHSLLSTDLSYPQINTDAAECNDRPLPYLSESELAYLQERIAAAQSQVGSVG